MYTNRKKEKRERESVENKKALLFLVESRALFSFHLKVHILLSVRIIKYSYVHKPPSIFE